MQLSNYWYEYEYSTSTYEYEYSTYEYGKYEYENIPTARFVPAATAQNPQSFKVKVSIKSKLFFS